MAQIDIAGLADFDDGELQVPVRKIGLARETWKNLKKNRLALVGLGLIILITFAVVFADFIAPYGIDDQTSSRVSRALRRNICSERTISGATFLAGYSTAGASLSR
jgi:ABC-type antimicrobial peptide transport system permease subunit